MAAYTTEMDDPLFGSSGRQNYHQAPSQNQGFTVPNMPQQQQQAYDGAYSMPAPPMPNYYGGPQGYSGQSWEGGGGGGMYGSQGVPPMPPPQPGPSLGAGQGFADFGIPTNFGSMVSNSLMAGLAGEQLADLQEKKEAVGKGISRVRCYFNVNNSYVLNKLMLVVFPWRHRNWQRRQEDTDGHTAMFLPPRDDINAPDLYIPAMAFVTFIVVAGIYYGRTNSFTPEKLGIVASSTLAWLAVEIAVIMAGFYVLGVGAAYSFFDLVAYCGYKYVGMVLELLAFILAGRQGYYVALLIAGLGIFFFVARTLAYVVQPEGGATQYTSPSSRRMYIIPLVAALQPALMYWLTSL